MKHSLHHLIESIGKGGTLLFALFLMALPLWHMARKARRWQQSRRRVLPALLLVSGGAYAQGPPSGTSTVQNYDTTTVSWTLPAGMSHKVARQAAATLTKLGTDPSKATLTPADSAFLYKWMPGVLETRRRQP